MLLGLLHLGVLEVGYQQLVLLLLLGQKHLLQVLDVLDVLGDLEFLIFGEVVYLHLTLLDPLLKC